MREVPETDSGGGPKRLRVLRVMHGLCHAGTERQCVDVVDAAKGHSELTLDLKTFLSEPHWNGLQPPERYELLPGTWTASGVFKATRLVADQLRQYDVVHALLGPAITVTAAARRLAGSNIPFVASIHSSQLGYDAVRLALFRAALRSAGRVVFNSEPGRRELAQQLGLDAHRVSVVPNGKLVHAIGEGARTGLVCVASVRAPKRQALLLDALGRLPLPRPTTTFLGQGTDAVEFIREAQRVSAVGAGRVQDPFEYILGAEIAALPTDHEGMPNAVLEAWDCGAAFLGSNVDGVRDLVNHGEDGWLVDNEPDAWADAIKHLRSNVPLRTRLANNGRARLLAEFSIDATIAAWLRIYRAA